MTLPSSNTIASARKAASRMADRNTPFIFDEWYVAALGSEIGRELLPRRLLGKRIVFYRDRQGKAVALADRCAHRSFPLSRGHLDGDDVVCGYHGFRYDPLGDLIEVPSQKNCPRGVGVKRYALIERGPLVWIWMGDPAEADESKFEAQDWMEQPTWACKTGYFHHPGNYVSMHENLMDLTHVAFLHAKTLGSGVPDYASAPYKFDLTEGHYKLTREVVPTTLSPVWGRTTGLEGNPNAARIITSEYLSPALQMVRGTFYDSTLPSGSRPEFHVQTAHILTPEDRHSTHYFVVHGRDFGLQDEELAKVMMDGLFAAFQEDVEGLGALERVIDDIDDDHYEISVASDAPAVALRSHLKKRAEAEQARHAGTADDAASCAVAGAATPAAAEVN